MIDTAVVTGAFGYTGRHISSRLLDRGTTVRTLTNDSSERDPFGGAVSASRLDFCNFDGLVHAMRGAQTLFNTYWVRFRRGQTSFERAVANSSLLFAAARDAGVQRVVHVSITNPFDAPDLGYFKGKADVEVALRASGLAYGIVRPTVIFGGEDVFINNIAWILRNLPAFAIPGSGSYRMQPVHVDDVAQLCIEAADGGNDMILDAAGPRVLTFRELLETIRAQVCATCRLISVPPGLALTLARAVGVLRRDVILTRGELDGLMRELIVSRNGSPATTDFNAWLAANAQTLGVGYSSELDRNYRSRKMADYV